MPTYKPISDRVLVRPIEANEEKVGGIIIPDTAKEKPQEGEVVSTGPGRLLESGKLLGPEVKAGDRILFGQYAGTELKKGAERFLIMREDEIFAVVEKG